MLKRIILMAGIGISLFLGWFALSNYRAYRLIAEENLHGLAHSLANAVQSIIVDDPSAQSISDFHPKDIVFFALIDAKGTYRFHSNKDLIGTTPENDKYKEAFQRKSIVESRTLLGTGEKAYEYYTPLYLPGETLVLRLALHTFKADAVVRRAKFDMGVLFTLLIIGWILGAVSYAFVIREERHNLEMARRERLAQLGEMGAMLAHEIRNPLAGIKGYVQLLERKPRDERNAAFARRVLTEVIRLENLVNDLLVFARSDSSQMSPIDLRALVSETLSLMRHEAERLGIAIANECPTGLRILGNQDMIGQVLLNLFKNAFQAMPEGGYMRIMAKATGSDITITVSDSGQGISTCDMHRIFEPFFTTKARGTGLGLAICQRIIKEHHGEIRVESVEGNGTSVSVILPGAEFA